MENTYRFSFTTRSGQRITWFRKGPDCYKVFDAAKLEALKEHSECHRFTIYSPQN